MKTRLAATVVALVLAGTGTVHASPPVQTLIGQQLQTCNAGAPLSLTVMDSLWWDAIQGNAPPAEREWLIVFFDAANPGVTDASAGSTLAVRDDQGREFASEDPDGRMSG